MAGTETLTEAEIETMEAGRELDALVAEEVLGFERVNATTLKKDGISFVLEQRNYPVGSFVPLVLPEYSTNMAAAWQVVDHLVHRPPSGNFSQFWDVGVGARRRMTNGELVWTATVQIPQKYGERKWAEDDARIAPLAICRAALKAAIKRPR